MIEVNSLKMIVPIVVLFCSSNAAIAQLPATQHDLGRALAGYREGKFSDRDFKEMEALLDSGKELRGDFEFTETVYEREIALMCLERMTNYTFYDKGKQKIKVKEIFSYTDKNGTYRFHVEEVKQEDLEGVKIRVKAWYSGYLFGKSSKTHK